MANEWIQKALGDRHHIILFLAFDVEKAGPEEMAFKMGVHPGLRHVQPRTIEKVLAALEDGIEHMRATPLDDLTIIGMEST